MSLHERHLLMNKPLRSRAVKVLNLNFIPIEVELRGIKPKEIKKHEELHSSKNKSDPVEENT